MFVLFAVCTVKLLFIVKLENLNLGVVCAVYCYHLTSHPQSRSIVFVHLVMVSSLPLHLIKHGSVFFLFQNDENNSVVKQQQQTRVLGQLLYRNQWAITATVTYTYHRFASSSKPLLHPLCGAEGLFKAIFTLHTLCVPCTAYTLKATSLIWSFTKSNKLLAINLEMYWKLLDFKFWFKVLQFWGTK